MSQPVKCPYCTTGCPFCKDGKVTYVPREMLGAVALGVPDTNPVGAVVETMSSLTDEQRIEVMGHFCRSCGCVQPETGMGCQCWNDE